MSCMVSGLVPSDQAELHKSCWQKPSPRTRPVQPKPCSHSPETALPIPVHVVKAATLMDCQ